MLAGSKREIKTSGRARVKRKTAIGLTKIETNGNEPNANIKNGAVPTMAATETRKTDINGRRRP